MTKYIVSSIIIYLFFGLLLYFFQRKIVFNVSGKPKKPIFYGLQNIIEIKILTDDGINLLCWHSKPCDKKPTLIYFHGNSFDIGCQHSNKQDPRGHGGLVSIFVVTHQTNRTHDGHGTIVLLFVKKKQQLNSRGSWGSSFNICCQQSNKQDPRGSCGNFINICCQTSNR